MVESTSNRSGWRPALSSNNPGATPRQRIRVANLILETLTELGVDTYYGIPGGAIACIYDALVDYPKLRVVNTRHETGAAFMAMGHARASGSIACLLTTSGPGITNAITGLAAALAESIPLIAIGGEVPRKNFGRGALQEGSRYQLDILGMVHSVTKFAAEISNPNAASTLVQTAVGTALSGRPGPVFLSLPLDVSNDRALPFESTLQPSTRFGIDPRILDRAAAALQQAERGLIFAGSGARHPEAVQWLKTLATTLNLPVMTTPKAKGLFPESNPLSLGVYGIGGHPSTIEYLATRVDTLLVVGSGLGEMATNGWSSVLRPSQTFIQIDIDSRQIGKNYEVDYSLVGPAHLVLAELASRARPRERPPGLTGVKHLEPAAMDDASLPLNPAFVLRTLQRMLPPDTIFSSDIGEHSLYAFQYLQMERPDFLVSSGLSSVGSGVGMAIGAKVSQPHRPVVAICGDHGFQVLGMELATCVHQEIGVVFAVFNDGCMRMLESDVKQQFGRTSPVSSHRIDFAAMAQALGGRGFTIRTAEDLAALPANLTASRLPTVLDIRIDPSSHFPMSGRVTQLRHVAPR